jgi:amidase
MRPLPATARPCTSPARHALRWKLVLTAAVTGAVLVPGSAFAAAPAAPAAPQTLAQRSAGSGTLPVRGLDLDAATIPELQARMADGSLTAVQLTQAYLDRIAAVDDDLGAVLAVSQDALDQAAAADDRRKHGKSRGAMDGIPVLLKDNVDTVDMPTTAGSRALLHSRPGDATITRKLRQAGAVIIGKANLSEWAFERSSTGTSGWSGVGGQTSNAYVLDRDPSGSSSGSAVGVAASLAQVAIGSETDGSIVSPSAANSAVGLKPTLGLVSRSGVVPLSAEQDTAGPIARHAVDAALLLQAVAGKDDTDAATSDIPAGALAGLAAPLDTSALKGARIGVWTLTPEQSAAVDDATEAVFANAVKEIQAAGATAVPVQLASQEEIGAGEGTALNAEFKRDINAYLAATPGDHPEDLAGLIAFDAQDPVELALFGQDVFEKAQASKTPAQDPALQKTRDTIRGLARASIDDALAQGPGAADDLDAIVALTNTPSDVIAYQNVEGHPPAFVYGSSTPAAVAGYPDATVPAGFSGPQHTLPVGISFFGTRWDDADVMDLAASFEATAQARRAPGYLPTVGDWSPAPAQP